MKYIIPTLIIGLFLASCAETEVPEITPKVSHQVTFEVYCDSCEASYAINGINPPEADSVFGFYSFDTTVFQGDGVGITGLSQNGESDSILVRILSDGVLLSDTVAYKDSPSDLFVYCTAIYVFQ